MKTTSLIATIVAMASAKGLRGKAEADSGEISALIVYGDGMTNEAQIDPNEFPAVFKWPHNAPRCGATMVSSRVALTAAHCVRESENVDGDLSMPIMLNDGAGNY